jgi:hypothetical protein
MINASTIWAPPVGRRWTILGGGIFNRNYGDFSTGIDREAESSRKDHHERARKQLAHWNGVSPVSRALAAMIRLWKPSK